MPDEAQVSVRNAMIVLTTANHCQAKIDCSYSNHSVPTGGRVPVCTINGDVCNDYWTVDDLTHLIDVLIQARNILLQKAKKDAIVGVDTAHSQV